MLNEEELKDAALLVFANKQDQPGAKGAGEISEALQLGELRDRNWSIMACSAVDGSGVNEGMDWLVVSFFFSMFLKIDASRVLEYRTRLTLNVLTLANRQLGQLNQTIFFFYQGDLISAISFCVFETTILYNKRYDEGKTIHLAIRGGGHAANGALSYPSNRTGG